jgi:hypothetical protein
MVQKMRELRQSASIDAPPGAFAGDRSCSPLSLPLNFIVPESDTGTTANPRLSRMVGRRGSGGSRSSAYERRTPAVGFYPPSGGVLLRFFPWLHAPTMRNKSAPLKWSKLWRDVPQPCDYFGAYTTEQLERMNQEFTAAVERAFHAGDESEVAATATYDLRRR